MKIGFCPVCGKRVCCASGRAPRHGYRWKWGWNKELSTNHTPTAPPCKGWRKPAQRISDNPKYWPPEQCKSL